MLEYTTIILHITYSIQIRHLNAEYLGTLTQLNK